MGMNFCKKIHKTMIKRHELTEFLVMFDNFKLKILTQKHFKHVQWYKIILRTNYLMKTLHISDILTSVSENRDFWGGVKWKSPNFWSKRLNIIGNGAKHIYCIQRIDWKSFQVWVLNRHSSSENFSFYVKSVKIQKIRIFRMSS